MLSILPIIALLSALGLMAPYATKTAAPTVRIDSAACSYAIDTVDDPAADPVLLSRCHAADPADWPWASAHAVNDSAAVHVQSLLADSANLPAESVRRLHEMESSARGLPDLESQRALETDPSETAAPTTRTLSALPSAAPVQMARLEIQEPARASTCYIGLDCPE